MYRHTCTTHHLLNSCTSVHQSSHSDRILLVHLNNIIPCIFSYSNNFSSASLSFSFWFISFSWICLNFISFLNITLSSNSFSMSTPVFKISASLSLCGMIGLTSQGEDILSCVFSINSSSSLSDKTWGTGYHFIGSHSNWSWLIEINHNIKRNPLCVITEP